MLFAARNVIFPLNKRCWDVVRNLLCKNVLTFRFLFSGIFTTLFPFFIIYLLSFILLAPAHAQTSTTPNTDPNVPNNLHTYTQNVILEVFSAVGCQIAGVDLASPKEQCLGLNPQTGRIGYVSNGGLLGTSVDMIAALYTPPAHVSDFTHYLSSNFGFAKPTYAQGVGYTSITPLVEIWKIFRNIVYLFFVIIFVLVGFAVMLRFKIDPRTVMSIENQLPKLIIGLLLVTFSFAIAGLLIDGMWIFTFLVINILSPSTNIGIKSADPAFLTPQAISSSIFQNPFGFANNVMPNGLLGASFGAGGSAGDVIRSLFTPANANRLGLVPPSQICTNSTPLVGWIGTAFCNLGGTITGAITGAVGFIVSWIIGIVATVVILIALLVALFRVWFSLLLAYAYILLDIVIAPFFIIFGLIPGSKISFGAWVRDMLANLISFPTIIALFLLGRLFMQAFSTSSQTLFVPPLIGNPLGGEATTNPLGWLIGLALILATPAIVNTMKKLFKAPQNTLA